MWRDDEVEDIFSQELEAVAEEDEEDLLNDDEMDAYAAMYDVVDPPPKAMLEAEVAVLSRGPEWVRGTARSRMKILKWSIPHCLRRRKQWHLQPQRHQQDYSVRLLHQCFAALWKEFFAVLAS